MIRFLALIIPRMNIDLCDKPNIICYAMSLVTFLKNKKVCKPKQLVHNGDKPMVQDILIDKMKVLIFPMTRGV
jgi:hypothetical protein